MRKDIVLRLMEHTELPPQLMAKLGKLLPNFRLLPFNHMQSHQENIARRITSLHEAFLFILEAYPLDPQFTRLRKETLMDYAEEALAACDLDSASVEHAHQELEHFTEQLVKVIVTAWHWAPSSELKEAIACLNDAEQYVIMRKGRCDVATLMPMDFGHAGEYVLQVDESLPPYNDIFLQELALIKAQGFPKTPDWFRSLNQAEKVYLCHPTHNEPAADSLISALYELHGIWQNIRKNPFDLNTDLSLINNQHHPLPAWFNALDSRNRELIKALSASPALIDTALMTLKQCLKNRKADPDFNAQLTCLSQIPLWYWVIPKHQHYFLEQVFKTDEPAEQLVSFLSSRHRTLPIPANFGQHSLYRVRLEDGEYRILPLFVKRVRSAHIASRDGLKESARFPLEVLNLHADRNLAQVLRFATQGQPVLFQTLISPVDLSQFLPEFLRGHLPVLPTWVKECLPHLPPDWSLHDMARAAVARSHKAADISEHNHPFNKARYIIPTQSNNPDSLALLVDLKHSINLVRDLNNRINALLAQKVQEAVQERMLALDREIESLQRQLPPFHKNIDELEALASEYKSVLESPAGTATIWDYSGRELFLSSLEQLIIWAQEGYSYGSCVSGKDRKAIELMHTDAMLLYKARYGTWPQIIDATEQPQQRAHFVSLLADLYLSHHQHVLAGQNAPGAEGIKTPYRYLPEDVCYQLNRRLGAPNRLTLDDQLASTNEVKDILMNSRLPADLISQNKLLPQLITKQLGEAVCTELYDILALLISQERLFNAPRFLGFGLFPPHGIANIYKIIFDKNSGSNSMDRIAKIMTVVLGRPEEDKSRTKETTAIYKGILSLLDPQSEITAATLIRSWNELFETTKERNSPAYMSPRSSPALSE